MALEQAQITFYKINQAGFYKRGETGQSEFGSSASLLQELSGWSQGKSLAVTKTFEPVEGAEFLPVYLMDITADRQDWLVTMWNQTPATQGKVAAAMGDSAVGNAQVVMNAIPEGGIPGFATYFWFVPEEGVFASIRFQHLITGQKPMQEYMEAYLGHYSTSVVFTDPDADADLQILGYRRGANDPVRNDVSPRFRTQILKKAGEHNLLLDSAHLIRKVVRKTSLQLNRPEELAFWQKAYRMATLRHAQNLPDEVNFKYEVKARMDRDEVQNIIETWTENHETEWDDYGFVLNGQSSPHWLSHAIARSSFSFDIERNNLEVVNPVSLLRALGAQRVDILNLMR
ncbi:hypothetical protein [Pseudomonas putida]|uniref:hypothetical protein n=1 Tax=Pseudomonas putida TaxID=303 RepID=UPI003D35153F